MQTKTFDPPSVKSHSGEKSTISILGHSVSDAWFYLIDYSRKSKRLCKLAIYSYNTERSSFEAMDIMEADIVLGGANCGTFV